MLRCIDLHDLPQFVCHQEFPAEEKSSRELFFRERLGNRGKLFSGREKFPKILGKFPEDFGELFR
jgi:hypothetical protein